MEPFQNICILYALFGNVASAVDRKPVLSEQNSHVAGAEGYFINPVKGAAVGRRNDPQENSSIAKRQEANSSRALLFKQPPPFYCCSRKNGSMPAGITAGSHRRTHRRRLRQWEGLRGHSQDRECSSLQRKSYCRRQTGWKGGRWYPSSQ